MPEYLRTSSGNAAAEAPRLNYYTSESPDGVGFWPLSEFCPCDNHFRDWLEENRIHGSSIFHFGTGGHHVLGLGELGRERPNFIFSVTASPQEYEKYIEIIIENPSLAHNYKVIFTDIYTYDGSLLPNFNIVTLFHLCEYWDPRKSSYAKLDDRSLLDLMVSKLTPGGYIVAFPYSRTWEWAEPIFADAVRRGGLESPVPYKTLLFYRRRREAGSAGRAHRRISDFLRSIRGR